LAETLLREEFHRPIIDSRLLWFNEPKRWHVDMPNHTLVIEPDAATDFWQQTHYRFRADSGHALFYEVEGAFSVETEVDFFFQHQYDQAGLMIRVSPECWIKTSVEFEPREENWLGAVVTNSGFSDWSTQKLPDSVESLAFRISREKSDYLVEYRESHGPEWIQLRLAHLDDTDKMLCGLYACSPKKNGFTAEFHYLEINAP
jgi:regulation of enolase protein 1 (concanavalin A-like superfamily)